MDKAAKKISLFLLISLILFVPSCRKYGSALPKSVDTKDSMYTCSLIILLAEEESGQPPPLEMKDLVTWIEMHSVEVERHKFVDLKQKRLVDSWGREFVLTVCNQRLVALGSTGPDGIWAKGQGDDIVFLICSVITGEHPAHFSEMPVETEERQP